CACYFGGLIITNNCTCQVLKRLIPSLELSPIIYVPRTKKYMKDVDVGRLSKIKPLIEYAFQEAHRGNYWFALTLNGLAYSEAFGYDTDPIRQAIFSGAIASGLTGKGPAFVAIVPKANLRKVRKAWSSLPGKIIEGESMRVTISPRDQLAGVISSPSSKAQTHRALFAGLLTNGTTTVRNPLASDDTEATTRAIVAAGAKVVKDSDTWTITSIGRPIAPEDVIDCGESGVTMRFTIPILSLTGSRATLRGQESLLRRPIEPLSK